MAGRPVQVRRKALEQERAHLFPHIPLVEGILEKAVEPGAVVKVRACFANFPVLGCPVTVWGHKASPAWTEPRMHASLWHCMQHRRCATLSSSWYHTVSLW